MKAGSDRLMSMVLIADDDAVCRLFCRQSLARSGRSILECSTGRDAIQQALNTRPRIILIDFYLPDMSGVEVTASILQAWPGAATESFFIGMTADTSGQARDNLLVAGCTYVLTKPFRASELLEAIDECQRWDTTEPRTLDCPNPLPGTPLVVNSHQAAKSGLQTAFLNELKHQLGELDRAFTSLDWDQAANVLHRITGSAALSGHTRFSAKSRELLRHLRKRECSAHLAENYLDLLAQATDLVRRLPAPPRPELKYRG